MSALREALEFIDDWIERNMPDHPAVMRQGLSREEIENKIKALAFKLPEEVYDFYQWHNGGLNPFLPSPEAYDLARFPSLEESVQSAKDYGFSFSLFPLFDVESGLLR